MDALVVGITTRKVNWILDADIEKFFDSVSQEWLVRFVEPLSATSASSV
jgi:RNA-directed DNA polymerase